MRVLVTGLDGFTGRYLEAAFADRGWEGIGFFDDITDTAAVRAAVTTARPDRVVHLAVLAFVQSDDFMPFYRVNQLGTFNLLAALAELAPGTPCLIASSANIYGNRAEGLLNEATPPDPVNHYAVSKWAMELGARQWADRLPLTVVRPFNYTGVGQEARYLVPKIVDHFKRRADVIELGNLDVRRDFGDVRAVVDAYCDLIERGGEGTYNVASGQVWSIRDLIDILERLSGHTIEVRVNPDFVRQNEVAVLAGDASRLRAALPAWQSRPIDDTLAWMLTN